MIYGPFYSSLNFRVFIWFFCRSAGSGENWGDKISPVFGDNPCDRLSGIGRDLSRSGPYFGVRAGCRCSHLDPPANGQAVDFLTGFLEVMVVYFWNINFGKSIGQLCPLSRQRVPCDCFNLHHCWAANWLVRRMGRHDLVATLSTLSVPVMYMMYLYKYLSFCTFASTSTVQTCICTSTDLEATFSTLQPVQHTF